MKKIITLIFLSTLVKAQIVQPKSTTTFSNVRATGSMTVAGTLKLGSATLTGGNTGTVAVLSDAVFPVYLQHNSTNPVDATTYYFGNLLNVLSTNPTMGNITLPYNCTLVSWNYNTAPSGLATSETATLSIAGSTNYTLSSSITYSAYPSSFSGTGLSQNFNAGNVINAKLITPTWATNPTGVIGGLTLWFVRRQ